MRTLHDYNITFSGLKQGIHHFDYEINNVFFQNFDYREFNSINAIVNLVLKKKPTHLELNFTAIGKANLNCDVSNEPYDQVIEDKFELVVKFDNEYNNENEEILVLPHGAYEINVAQYVYELIVLGLPTKRLHPGLEDGTLQSEILDKLNELSPKLNIRNRKLHETDPRWDNLKELLTDK